MSLLLAAALSWTLGAEVPIDPYTKVIPAQAQHDPDIASNGTDALAVWIDYRSWLTRAKVRMTRLHGEHPLEPFGTEIAVNAAAVKVASDGRDYLVAYSVYRDLFGYSRPFAHAAHVEDGRITRRTEIGTGAVAHVASDGATYCVIVDPEHYLADPTVVLLTLDGTVLAKHKLPARGQAVLPRREGGFWVVAIVDQILQLIPVTSSGIGEGRHIRAVPDVRYVTAVAGRNQILLSWKPDARLAYLLLDGNLQPVGAYTLLRYFEEVPAIPVLAWDGREFLLDSQTSYKVRVSMDGKASVPFFRFYAGATAAAAFDGRRTILLTYETSAIHARLIESFATYTDRAGSPITFSGQTQYFVSGASEDGTILALNPNGSGVLRRADGSTTRVEAGLVGQRYSFAVDSIVGAKDVFLVVYRTSRSDAGVAVRCVRSDGTVLEPVVLPTKKDAIEPAAATDGTGFLVAWNEERFNLRGARITMDGTMDGVSTITSVSDSIGDLRLAWAGEAYVLAWRDREGYAIARVGADGTRLGAPQHFPRTTNYDETYGSYRAVAAGANGDGALVLLGEQGCISAIPLARDGRLLREPRSVLCNQYLGFQPDLDIAWDGSGYTVSWSGYVDLVPAIRTSRDGTVLTPVQDLGPAGIDVTDATLLRAGDRLYLLYHRAAPEEPYAGVMRAYLRSLDVVNGPGRTRAVRH